MHEATKKKTLNVNSTVHTNLLYSNHEEAIFVDGGAYFKHLIQDIKTAQHTIKIEAYKFNHDVLGHQLAQALAESAKRGVKVKLLVDGAGTPFWGRNLAPLLDKSGVKSRIFHPFPWGFWQRSRSVVRLPFLLKTIYLVLKINSRNHRKICIIDEKIAYIGSCNVDLCHLKKVEGGKDWRDTVVRLSGLDLQELSLAFEAAWDHMPLQERLSRLFQHVDMNSVLRLNNTLYRRRVLYKNLLRRIAKAKHRIWITNAYFLPDKFILKKLKDAAETGIDVRVLLPSVSDVPIMPLTSSMFYHSLLRSGVRIFEYLPSMLHAKTLILDDWFVIGSTNLNSRSLLHDLEVDVNLKKIKSKTIIETQFFKDLSQSREIRLHEWKRRRFYQRVLGHALLYLRYWF